MERRDEVAPFHPLGESLPYPLRTAFRGLRGWPLGFPREADLLYSRETLVGFGWFWLILVRLSNLNYHLLKYIRV